MRQRNHLSLTRIPVLCILQAALATFTPAAEPPASFEERIADLEHRPGLLDLYLDQGSGKVLLAIPAASGPGGVVGEFLYVEGLVTGLGSNPVGLDRGQLGPARLVRLRRLGGRLLVEEVNLRYRATGSEAEERRAAAESFATSVLWGGELAATADDGRGLVDITGFIARDAHGVTERLAEAGQGSFAVEPERSAVDLEACLAFPDNLELEAVVTWTAKEPGLLVRQTAPSAGAVTLVQHQSLIRLPDTGYRPRGFDPRSGSFAVHYLDYAVPLSERLERGLLVRHRLAKVDSRAPRAPARRPIVYYVDRGAPEPVRQALVDGAAWWAAAFEAAGFEDAFRVELLPPQAHPLDVRYNVIQWVHRSTRGWSYGGGVVDPRTGEMVKGHVTLGSQRIRHDRLIFEGLLGADRSGSGADADPVELALARIRQLAAHEVGHTLGLAHNFAASTYGRASVMDYPAPLVAIGDDGELDVSDAYAEGLGSWDLQAIRYAYSEVPAGTGEQTFLDAILRDGLGRGLLFLSDQDARPAGAAHPLASLWDNGADPLAQLEQDLAVRRFALARFGARNVPEAIPLAYLEEVLATVYFRHRYQLDAAAKLIGGIDYRYALRGDGQPLPQPVSAARQRLAIAGILALLAPAELDLPETVLAVLHPRPHEMEPNPEMFAGAAAPGFDPLSAAAAAADIAVGALLVPERAQRLVDLHRRDPDSPGLDELLDALLRRSFSASPPALPRHREIQRVVQQVTVARLISLAEEPRATPPVRSRAAAALERLRGELAAAREDGGEQAQRSFLLAEIRRFQESPLPAPAPQPPPSPPPGQPIGQGPVLPTWAEPDFGACGFDGPAEPGG